MRRGMPLTSWDSSGRLHNDDGINSRLRQQHQRQHPHPSQSSPLPQLLNIRLFPSPSTIPRSDDGSTPTQLLPAPCSVSSRPQDTCLSSFHAPIHPVPILTAPGWGGEHRGVWGQLEVRMEVARRDDITNSEDEMRVTMSRLSGSGGV